MLEVSPPHKRLVFVLVKVVVGVVGVFHGTTPWLNEVNEGEREEGSWEMNEVNEGERKGVGKEKN